MAEIARDAILYGGKDVAKAQKAAEDLLQKLVANGCDEAKQLAARAKKAGWPLNEARSVIVVLCGEGDGAQEPNFDRFWRYLKRSADRVEQLTTAVLDIGDGALGALVSKRFEELGSAPITDLEKVVAALKPTASTTTSTRENLRALRLADGQRRVHRQGY